MDMMPQSGTPIFVLKEGTRRERGKGAQFNNIAAAKAVADAVRSTLGPRGMDKMLVDSLGDVVITNDGGTILQQIAIPSGYRLAADKAREILEKVATKVTIKDTQILTNVATTAMASKSASGHKDHLADIGVKDVTTVA